MEITKTIGDRKYRYLKLGSGRRKLLVLWGFASFKENAAKLVHENFSDYTVVIPEYPYHNSFDDAGLEDISIEALSEYLQVLLCHEGFTNFDVLGFSLGGLVALKLAESNKDFRIGKAVIWASPVLGYAGITGLPNQLVETYTKLPKNRLEDVQRSRLLQKVLLTKGVKVFSPDRFKQYLAMVRAYKLVFLPDEVACLFIYDPRDVLVSIKNARYVRELSSKMPNCKILELAGSGHFGSKATWDRVLKEITAFLT